MAELSLKKGDFFAAGLVLFLAAALTLCLVVKASGVEEMTVQIYREGALLCELPLERDADYEVNGAYANTISIRDGRVAVTKTDCPGEDCSHSGWISNAGRSIVCLPNKLEVRLSGDSEIDAEVR